MPLLDHFRPPLDAKHHWESFHSNWATRLADQLNERLPEGLLKFKEGFGGRVVRFAGAFDVVYNRPLYRVLDFLIAKRRGLT